MYATGLESLYLDEVEFKGELPGSCAAFRLSRLYLGPSVRQFERASSLDWLLSITSPTKLAVTFGPASTGTRVPATLSDVFPIQSRLFRCTHLTLVDELWEARSQSLLPFRNLTSLSINSIRSIASLLSLGLPSGLKFLEVNFSRSDPPNGAPLPQPRVNPNHTFLVPQLPFTPPPPLDTLVALVENIDSPVLSLLTEIRFCGGTRDHFLSRKLGTKLLTKCTERNINCSFDDRITAHRVSSFPSNLSSSN